MVCGFLGMRTNVYGKTPGRVHAICGFNCLLLSYHLLPPCRSSRSHLTSSAYFESPHLLVALSGSRSDPMIVYAFPGSAYTLDLGNSRRYRGVSTSILQSIRVCLISLESVSGLPSVASPFNLISGLGSPPGFVWSPGYPFEWSPASNGRNSNP